MTSNGSRIDVVDIRDYVLENAKRLLDQTAKETIDMTQTEIKWDSMYVSHGVTRYENEHRPQKSTENVLMSANFTNNTPDPKTFTFITERRTTSTCDINLTKSFTIGGSINLQLTPPSAAVQANAGFGMRLSQEKGINQTFERELIWTMNKDIVVPSHHVTKEEELGGELIVRTRFQGHVKVVFKTKKGKEVVGLVQKVEKILNNAAGFETEEDGRVSFVTRGSYMSRFGIQQDVQCEERPLP